ncbi:N-acetylglutamate kinase [Aquiflexum balticum DSM 16537]|uniref:Acetylglutamate kinase n=1 Tax=Aquiflexum balticum DSM 16537 TaxID=758820 RepID=A0A1W2GZ96_9BACT|nr:acetylglutamate kinase [Aquiflexum balticum]SMD41931.1 N-acetylglutamate kinase [Aquiflexum balticum DSM 16537]
MNPSKILIKYGGNAMTNTELQKKIAGQIHLLKLAGHQVVLVHGGGPFINRALEKAAIHSKFIEGQRVTSPEALVEIQKTLIGDVNASLVKTFNNCDVRAVGLSGLDGRMVLVTKKSVQMTLASGEIENLDLGSVGEVIRIDSDLIEIHVRNNFTPIIACIASDMEGNTYNVNADNFAGALAAAMKADFYITLTDVDGLYLDFPDPASILDQVSIKQLQELYGTVIKGGMIPKIQAIEAALNGGLSKALILNGTKPEQLYQFFEENKRIGTSIIH